MRPPIQRSTSVHTMGEFLHALYARLTKVAIDGEERETEKEHGSFFVNLEDSIKGLCLCIVLSLT